MDVIELDPSCQDIWCEVNGLVEVRYFMHIANRAVEILMEEPG